MFDFRYHALALVGVFLALAIGLLLGVAIGDRGLVSSASDKLSANLREEVEAARTETRRAEHRLKGEQRYEWQTLPALIDSRLSGRRVAVIFINGRSQFLFRNVRAGISQAGGQLASVHDLREPLDLDAIAGSAAGTRYKDIEKDGALLLPFARRIGTQMVTGGKLIKRVRRALFDSSSGKLDGVEAVVVVNGNARKSTAAQAKQEELFAREFIKGLTSFQTPVVGVEASSTRPSQVSWYAKSKISTVDNINHPSGRASLAITLAGEANGAFGSKSTADALLPDALTRGRL